MIGSKSRLRSLGLDFFSSSFVLRVLPYNESFHAELNTPTHRSNIRYAPQYVLCLGGMMFGIAECSP